MWSLSPPGVLRAGGACATQGDGEGLLDHGLLKGREDLRQDERVMQLFGLVNALLANDRDTCKHDLAIRRYAVIPLSHNCLAI